MRSKTFATLAAAVVALSGFAASAQAPACPLPYKVFEFAVPHLDLETCPASLARTGAFCRATTGMDAVHVFVFAQDGDQCILQTKTFPAGEFTLTVK